MYRRSSSSSNIPVLTVLGAKDSRSSKIRERSESTSRLSHRDKALTHNQPWTRQSSLDRKSSTSGLLRTTPLTKFGASTSGLQKTTPSSAVRQDSRSSRATITPASSRKEHITIQKLSTDKKWVLDQFVKVQNFITSSELFDPSVVEANNIRPPSINVFIYVTGVLLMEIFPKVKIVKENYKEVVPAQLKLLRYPGSMTSSILKTVNTMRSWPQVIGMWSWLIDKVNVSKGIVDNSFINSITPEERTGILLTQSVSNFLIKRYNIFNQGESASSAKEIEKTNEEHVKNLAEILNVDFELCAHLQEDVAKKKEYKHKLIQEIDELKSRKSELKSGLDEMKQEIEESQENGAQEEKDLDDELQLIESNLVEYRDTNQSLRKDISELKEAIKVQPCTREEYAALVKQTEQLKSDIEVKRGKIQHAKEIKNEYDGKLTTAINNIRSLVIDWNRSLMEISIRKPEFKKLLLREKGFHDPHFLTELQEVSKGIRTLNTQIEDATARMELEVKAQERVKSEAETEYLECAEILRQTEAKCAAVSVKIEEKLAEIKKTENDLEALKKSHAEQIEELQKCSSIDLENQKRTIVELKEKKERKEVELKEFGPKMINFFIEMHNQIVNNLTEMDKIKEKMVVQIESKHMRNVEKQRKIIEILKSFPDC